MNASFDLVENDLGQLALKRPGEEDVADIRIKRAGGQPAAISYHRYLHERQAQS